MCCELKWGRAKSTCGRHLRNNSFILKSLLCGLSEGLGLVVHLTDSWFGTLAHPPAPGGRGFHQLLQHIILRLFLLQQRKYSNFLWHCTLFYFSIFQYINLRRFLLQQIKYEISWGIAQFTVYNCAINFSRYLHYHQAVPPATNKIQQFLAA